LRKVAQVCPLVDQIRRARKKLKIFFDEFFARLPKLYYAALRPSWKMLEFTAFARSSVD
jgi:hypothetical protein